MAVTSSSSGDKGNVKGKGADHEKVSFFKLFSFADGLDILLMMAGTIGAVGNGLSQPFMLVIFGQLINSVGHYMYSKSLMHEVGVVSLRFCFLAIFSAIASFIQVSCWMVTGERQATRIRGLYLKTILRQEIGFFDSETTTGDVVGRMSGDTILIQEAMGEKVGKFIQYLSGFIGGFVIAFIKGWLLALVLTACIPLFILAGGFMSLIMSKMSVRAQVAYAEAGNVLEQTVGGIRTVASFTGEKQAIQNYNSKLQKAYGTTVKQELALGLGFGSFLFILFCIYGLAMWYGSKLIIYKGYKSGDIINILLSVTVGGTSLGQAPPCVTAFAAGRAAAFNIFQAINRKPQIDAYDTSGVVLEEMKGEIELKDVCFRYPARPEVQIFAGFSLYVPSGTTAALVGHSGSGKSTVISLLERFYDPDAGEVLIDGVNLKEMQVGWLRSKVGLVSQEPVLFATTIRENILYGKANASESDIRTAIILANAAKFIDKLPEGLDTMVGDHGTQLSGGQKQRIAIARAILKDPKILLLDEATSALDVESERIIQKALENVMSNRTTVIVAHRLTTIRNADLIAVVQAGKLVEKGTHDELSKDPNGAYSQLIRMQEGSKQTENTERQAKDKLGRAINADDNLSRSSRRKMSIRRSTSKGSSRGSFSLCQDVLDVVEIHETGRGKDSKAVDKRDLLEKRKKSSIARLAKLNKLEAPALLLGSLAGCAHGVILPIFGLLLAKSITTMYEPAHQLRKDAILLALKCVGLGIVAMVVIPVQNYFFGVAGAKLIQRIRCLTFEKVVHQEISWFDDPKNSSGAVGSRLSTDASTLRGLVGGALALIVQNIATVVTGLVMSFMANWKLAFIILVPIPLIGLQEFLQVKFIRGSGGDFKAMYEEASQVASDAVGSIRTIASFCAEEKVMEMYKRKCQAPVKQSVKLGILTGSCLGFGNFAYHCSNAFCFYIGAVLATHGEATFTEVFKVFFSLMLSAISVSQTMAMAPDMNSVKASAVSVFEILDSKPKIDASSNEGQTPERVRGDIELKHVSFKYPTRPDIQIFQDLCLTIPSGKTVALVGESGSGKSTVISLIERFYDPDSGFIYLDGFELRKLNISWLRQQIGLVGQEPLLFNETIRTNIVYGKQGNVTEEEIIAATKISNAHDFISALPNGYNTSVGERGIQLSGGQKQRIAIARAVLRDPRILLLDEATSALDAASERVVQDALDKVMVNRTTVVVAHRLSTIRGADVIAVVKNGVIAEKGRHEELMSNEDGVYASLVALQSNAA